MLKLIVAILIIIGGLVGVCALIHSATSLPDAGSDPLDDGDIWRRAFKGTEFDYDK